MSSGDGWVVRIRPRCGRLSHMQALGIARLAIQYASPVIELTTRANLQLRGVSRDQHPELVSALQALDLIDADAATESRRNILVTPFWNANDGTLEIARALSQALASPDAPDLPGKFGFGLDCGADLALRASPADIRVERADGGYVVYADGTESGVHAEGEEVVRIAMDMSIWFAQARSAHEGPGRMASLVRNAPVPAKFLGTPRSERAHRPPPLGLLEQGCLVGFEFGQLPAVTLVELAELGPLRLTPWRSVMVEGLGAMPQIAGAITQTNDVRLRTAACPGAPACTQAAGATREIARELAPRVLPGQLLHVSGCAKGCAHTGATLTAVARGTSWDFIHWGTADSPPDAQGLCPADLATYLQNLQHAPPV